MKVSTFRDLMKGHASAEIKCLYTGNVVRRLTVEGSTVKIDPRQAPAVTVDLSTAITYEPWVLDRGNMLFSAADVIFPPASPEMPPTTNLKICGEGDTIIFPDGSSDQVLPA